MQNHSPRTTPDQRRQLELLDLEALEQLQLERLNQMLGRILPANAFYARKLQQFTLPFESIDQLAELSYTFKNELLESDANGFAANLTWPPAKYCRFHRTSGTRGRPLVVLDTADDWQWWLEGWQSVLDTAQLSADDRVVMAFSFGPFIGFWSAFEAATERGALVAPTGAMSTLSRLELIQSIGATVVFCTPSYALHLAEVAAEHHLPLSNSTVEKIVVAGEPGGSVPAIRDRIEAAFGAKVIDHGGASEIGPWGFADPAGRGLYVNEALFVAEFQSVASGLPAEEGELSELILTTLGRDGCPVIRYRTGDLVRPTWNDDQPCRFVLLSGGILGRTDDMMIIRGVNVFPSAIEQIVRSFPEVVEYRLTAFTEAAMDQIKIEVEDRIEQPQRIVEALQVRLGLRVDVQLVPLASLPRFEAKGKRFIDQRNRPT